MLKLRRIKSPSLLYQRIDELVDRHGSYRAAGRVIEIDHGHLWNVRQGNKLAGDKLLKKLKLREVIYYEEY